VDGLLPVLKSHFSRKPPEERLISQLDKKKTFPTPAFWNICFVWSGCRLSEEFYISLIDR